MIDDVKLHDILFSNLEAAMLDMVDTSLARINYNHGLPENDRIAGVIKSVMVELATLPGEYWIPDDMSNDSEAS